MEDHKKFDNSVFIVKRRWVSLHSSTVQDLHEFSIIIRSIRFYKTYSIVSWTFLNRRFLNYSHLFWHQEESFEWISFIQDDAIVTRKSLVAWLSQTTSTAKQRIMRYCHKNYHKYRREDRNPWENSSVPAVEGRLWSVMKWHHEETNIIWGMSFGVYWLLWIGVLPGAGLSLKAIK